MNKKIWLGFAVLMLTLFLVSCENLKYEAYVTVVNIGNLPMKAWVDGDEADIAAYNSLTWSVPLDSENEVRSVLLEAEPLDGSDHDEITINLQGDRDVQTWLTGWDSVQGGKPLKRQSSLIQGAPDKGLYSSQR